MQTICLGFCEDLPWGNIAKVLIILCFTHWQIICRNEILQTVENVLNLKNISKNMRRCWPVAQVPHDEKHSNPSLGVGAAADVRTFLGRFARWMPNLCAVGRRGVAPAGPQGRQGNLKPEIMFIGEPSANFPRKPLDLCVFCTIRNNIRAIKRKHDRKETFGQRRDRKRVGPRIWQNSTHAVQRKSNCWQRTKHWRGIIKLLASNKLLCNKSNCLQRNQHWRPIKSPC